jgi:hypothetical protein
MLSNFAKVDDDELDTCQSYTSRMTVVTCRRGFRSYVAMLQTQALPQHSAGLASAAMAIGPEGREGETESGLA